MIPLKDELPTLRTPVLTLILIAINVLVYLAGFGTTQVGGGPAGLVASQHDVWIYEYGTIPCELFNRCDNQPGQIAVEGSGFLQLNPQTVPVVVPEVNPWLTVLTSAFLHGGFLHLAFNMLFLWVYGNNVEDSMSRPAFLGFYLAGAIVSALAQSLITSGSGVPQIGASGAIAATIGAYLLLYPKVKIFAMIIFPLFLWLPAWLVAGIWGLTQFFATTQSIFTPTVETGGVAYMAHLAGFAFGMAIIRQVARRNLIYEQLYDPGNATPTGYG